MFDDRFDIRASGVDVHAGCHGVWVEAAAYLATVAEYTESADGRCDKRCRCCDEQTMMMAEGACGPD